MVYGGAAQYAANLPNETHVLIEGELTYREYNRTIESELGSVNVQWPVAEIVVASIKVLGRKRKEANEMEGAAQRSLVWCYDRIADVNGVFSSNLPG